MYFFEIFERENSEPSAEFYGRRYEQDGDALYWDLDGNWYYSYVDRPDVTGEQIVFRNSESLHSGRSVDELLDNMRDWLEHMEFENGLPPILLGYAFVSVDVVGYDS